MQIISNHVDLSDYYMLEGSLEAQNVVKYIITDSSPIIYALTVSFHQKQKFLSGVLMLWSAFCGITL